MQHFVVSDTYRGKTRRIGESTDILLLEDNAATAERRWLAGVGSAEFGTAITICVHRFVGTKKTIAARKSYDAGSLPTRRATRIVVRASNECDLLGKPRAINGQGPLMTKTRPGISEDVVADVLYRSEHTCCVCTEPGKQVQIHHIDEDRTNNDPSNLAVLCTEDHNRAHLSGGFGRQLRDTEIRLHRDEWLARVERRRQLADERVVARMVGVDLPPKQIVHAADWSPPPRHALLAYINHLPDALAAAHAAEQERIDTGITSEMVQGTVRIADAVEQMWVYLSRWYPPGHFGDDAQLSDGDCLNRWLPRWQRSSCDAPCGKLRRWLAYFSELRSLVPR